MTEAEAQAHLSREAPNLKVVMMKPGQMWTRDFVTSRIRVPIGEDGKVSSEPNVG